MKWFTTVSNCKTVPNYSYAIWYARPSVGSYRKIREMSHGLTESDIFVLLAKRHRRHLLEILRESDTPLTGDELAARIADRDLEDPTVEDRDAVHVALYHRHLPKLEAADAVVYDDQEETIRPGVNFDTVVGFLERSREFDRSWTDE